MTQSSSFYWHDYETFGTHPARDRVAQFAGIRTDWDLNIIGKPLEIYCQLPSDYLPQPDACLITGITPQKSNRLGIAECEFIQRILQEFSQPQSCIVGYNNIRFDDEVTRNLLYRNFHDPYAYSYQQGNSRWDLLDVVRACYALRPDGVNWPVDEVGVPSFKLEKLSVANGLEHANAHDALSDVQVTIELARLLKTAQPRLFDYLLNQRGKRQVAELLDQEHLKPFVHVSGMFPATKGCVSWMSAIANHPLQSNTRICIDLTRDPSAILELDPQALHGALYTPRSERDDNHPEIPVKLIHTNKCPVVAPARTLSEARADELGIDRAQCRRSLDLLRQHHHEFASRLTTLFNQPYKDAADSDPDLMIYSGGFFADQDKQLLQTIHRLNPDQLAVESFDFIDQRLQEMLFRYRARNFPLTLNENETRRWQHHRQHTLEQQSHGFWEDFQRLAEQHQQDEKKMAILQALYHYAGSL